MPATNNSSRTSSKKPSGKKAKSDLDEYLSGLGWVEVRKTLLGMHATGPNEGPGWSNDGYYQAIYDVTVSKVINRVIFVKTQTSFGPIVRFYGEGYKAFSDLYKIYLTRANCPDGIAQGQESHALSARWQEEVILPAIKGSRKLKKLREAFHQKNKEFSAVYNARDLGCDA